MSGGRGRHGGADHEEAENGERWLLTYADMITLLLALFIVLFAMSTINVQKFMEFKSGVVKTFSTLDFNTMLKGGTGVLQHSSLISHPGTVPGIPRQTMSTLNTAVEQNSIASQLTQALAKAGLTQAASVSTDQRGVVVTILSDKVFFGVDSVALGTVGNAVIDTIAKTIAPLPNNISVEGYTDNQPIVGGPFTSNFELSAVRATTVVDRLAKVDGIPETRLSATGYGDTHNLVPNDNPTDMAINRRVDVVILNSNASPLNTSNVVNLTSSANAIPTPISAVKKK